MKVRLVLAGLGMAAVPVSGAAGFSWVTAISSLEGGIGLSGIDEYTIGNGGQIAAFAYDDVNYDLHLIYQPGNAVTTEATIVDTSTSPGGWNKLTLTGAAGAPQFTFVDSLNIYRHEAGTRHTLFGLDGWGKFESINAAGQVLVGVDQISVADRGFHIREVVDNAVTGSGPYATDYLIASGNIQTQSITPSGDIRLIHASSPWTIHSPVTYDNNENPWVGEVQIDLSTTINPVQLLGANDNTILFGATHNHTSQPNSIYLRSGDYLNPTYQELFAGDDTFIATGMLSPSGRAVVEIDHETLIYWDGTTRYDLSDDLAAAGMFEVSLPMISDGSDMVLFFGNSNWGLYGWRPGDGVFPIIETFSTAMIDGVEESVLFPAVPNSVNYYSDLISDDGHIAVTVTLGNMEDYSSWSTRVITLVPEPTMVGLAGLLAIPLLRRRRR